jgi:ureidoacrylate peracid hydrolase
MQRGDSMKCYVTSGNLEAKSHEWLEHIRNRNVHRMELKVERSALLVVDMQNFFLRPSSPAFLCAGLAILPNVKRLIAVARSAGVPVIYTAHVHHPGKIDAGILGWWWSEMCIEGTEESRIHPEIEPQHGEKIVYKHRYSAFYNTDLETVLRCMKVQDLVVSGVMTNICCESTAREAYFRDYRTFFLADGTATSAEEMHLASLLNLAYGFSYVTTVDEIIEKMYASSSSTNAG